MRESSLPASAMAIFTGLLASRVPAIIAFAALIAILVTMVMLKRMELTVRRLESKDKTARTRLRCTPPQSGRTVPISKRKRRRPKN